MTLTWRSIACLTLGSALANTSFAAGLGQYTQDDSTEEVVVTASQEGSLSAISPNHAREQLETIPGAIGFVDADDFLDNFTQSIGDTLVFTPGVYADTSAQRENRISIRGSGLNATFERRGITVLRDGVPISRASGITEFQEIDPLSIKYIEVFKGANGLRYGAASLGGAINIVTPTGKTQDSGTNIRIEGGSFDTSRFSINTAGLSDNIDYYVALTKLDSDGFRDHSEVDSTYAFGNLGIAINDNIETRFYLTALQDNFELSGSLTREQALDDPSQTNSSNIDNDQDRNLDVYRFSNRTVVAFDTVTAEFSAWATRRLLDHAITPFVGIIDQDETEHGFSSNIDGTIGTGFEWLAGLRYASSSNEARVFINNSGRNGRLVSEDKQDSENLTAYLQGDIDLSHQLSLILGLQYVDSKRKNRDIIDSPVFGSPKPDTGKLDFDNVNARIGLLWAASENQQHFINISQGYEPPGISDITSGGAQPFTVLNAQESITYEIGTRGQSGILSWDVAIYRSEIENEFIDVAEAAQVFGPPPPVTPTVTNTGNATGDTIHQGLELGLDLHLLNALDNNGWQLNWRNIATYNDFSFDNDPSYGDNKLAGVPELIYVTELRLDYSDTWYTGINYRHVANGAYADFENTIRAPGYQLVGLTAGWQATPSLNVFASIENLLDEEFISNVSTVADARTERGNIGNPSIFTPGEGRAAYVGISYSFK